MKFIKIEIRARRILKEGILRSLPHTHSMSSLA